MLTRRLGLIALALYSAALLSALLAMAAPGSATATGSPTAAATVDRLAAPAMVINPSQADVGAQLFWLHCQPCHGDQAQGLTDDWRAQYPPEDQNCWKSGCHGDRPYQNGFTLPHTIPALVGPGTLNHFATAADLYAFISRAMPFQAPGSLKPQEYWAITAFLLRGHGLSNAALPITDASAAQRIPLGTAATEAASVTPVATPSALAAASPAAAPGSQAGWRVTAGLIVLAGVAAGGVGWIVWKRTRGHG